MYEKCLVSKTQDVRRLQGKSFIYHIEGSLGITRCGSVYNVERVSYTELHEANGIATACRNCFKR